MATKVSKFDEKHIIKYPENSNDTEIIREQFKQKYLKRLRDRGLKLPVVYAKKMHGEGIVYPKMDKTVKDWVNNFHEKKKYNTKKGQTKYRDITRKSLKALDKFHDAGFAHRDLPHLGNVMMKKTKNGKKKVKLIDISTMSTAGHKNFEKHKKRDRVNLVQNLVIATSKKNIKVRKAAVRAGIDVEKPTIKDGDVNIKKLIQELKPKHRRI